MGSCGNSYSLRIFSCTANACHTLAEQFQPVPHHTPSPSLWCQLVWYYHSNGDNNHGSLAPSVGSRHNYHRWGELQMCAHPPAPFRPGLAPGRLPARTDTTIVSNRWIFTSRVRSKVLVCEFELTQTYRRTGRLERTGDPKRGTYPPFNALHEGATAKPLQVDHPVSPACPSRRLSMTAILPLSFEKASKSIPSKLSTNR